MILTIKRKGNNTVWCRILYGSLLFQKLKECSTQRAPLYSLVIWKKNSFHLEFLFHHDKFFKLISGRETPGCRLHLSSWCPLSPAVRKFYRIIAPFFVASLLLSIISCGQCPAKNKCSVILEKENNEFDLRDCLCQKSLEYQFVEVLSAQVFFSFFHPSFRNYFIYNINF